MADNWSKIQIDGTNIIPLLDPDRVIEFFTKIVDHERQYWSDICTSFLDLFDPDKCPEQYLPYLSSIIGLSLDQQDSVSRQRLQIKSAVSWYKEKGKNSAFHILFHSLGFDTLVVPVWSDKEGSTAAEELIPKYVPHARIDVYLFEREGNAITLTLEEIDRLLRRMEEVRPIHVLLRGFFTGKVFTDVFPEPSDVGVSPLDIRMSDIFKFVRPPFAYGTTCPLSHYYGARPAVLHDGKYFSNRKEKLNEITNEIYVRGDDYNQVGTLITRGNGIRATHGGNITNRSGTFNDMDGNPFVRDGKTTGVYYRNCQGTFVQQLSPDPLDMILNRFFEDLFGESVFLHDNYIPERNGTLDRSGTKKIVDTTKHTGAHIIEDSTNAVSESTSMVLSDIPHVSRVNTCSLYRDGIDIPNRNSLTVIYHGDNFVYHRDGSLLRDGTIPSRQEYLKRDGTLIHRVIGGGLGVYDRSCASPYADCSAPEGDYAGFVCEYDMPVDTLNFVLDDILEIEQLIKQYLSVELSDVWSYLRDGTHTRDGTIHRAHPEIFDESVWSLLNTTTDSTDTVIDSNEQIVLQTLAETFNPVIHFRDGSVVSRGLENFEYFHDGLYQRNGNIPSRYENIHRDKTTAEDSVDNICEYDMPVDTLNFILDDILDLTQFSVQIISTSEEDPYTYPRDGSYVRDGTASRDSQGIVDEAVCTISITLDDSYNTPSESVEGTFVEGTDDGFNPLILYRNGELLARGSGTVYTHGNNFDYFRDGSMFHDNTIVSRQEYLKRDGTLALRNLGGVGLRFRDVYYAEDSLVITQN